MQEIKFKVGDMVKILSEDRTFGWDDEMKKYIGTSAVVQNVNADMYSSNEYKVGYLIKGWWWSADALMKIENKFNPQPGDKIICNNGEEFICCTLEYLREKINRSICSSKSILGYDEDCNEWQDWHDNGYVFPDSQDNKYNIREVIPKQKEEDMPEVKYTAEDIRNAFSALKWTTTSYQKFIETLNKVVNPEYQEYLRLKAIYE